MINITKTTEGISIKIYSNEKSIVRICFLNIIREKIAQYWLELEIGWNENHFSFPSLDNKAIVVIYFPDGNKHEKLI